MKTTDNQNELFNIVDEKDNVVGQATRGEVHKNKSLIHRSVGVVVFNSRGEIFLQQRSAGKDTDPRKWTISASGHVSAESAEVGHGFFAYLQNSPALAGSNTVGVLKKHDLPADSYSPSRHPQDPNAQVYEEAAHRELREELGADLDIEPVAKYICRAPNETEMQMLFKTTYNGPFRLHPAEIAQGKFFTQKELVESLKSGKLKLSFMGKVALRKLGW
jgi:isopentenyldiphosphate isomerase